ncbi:EamA family transporter [bacterium]|nr:EamA family transporter [bacterium]
MVLFGTNAVILKSAKNIDFISLTLLSVGTSAILALLCWFILNLKKEMGTQGVSFGIISGILNGTGIILFNYAIQRGKASIVAPISALGAGVAVILAVVILSEKLTILQTIGIVLGLIAVVLLST